MEEEELYEPHFQSSDVELELGMKKQGAGKCPCCDCNCLECRHTHLGECCFIVCGVPGNKDNIIDSGGAPS
jgi:hypothetical protein